MRSSRHVLTLLAAATVVVAVLSVPASACGGLFCSSLSQLPVDQSAEQIVFIVGGEEITAHVQILYTGEAEDFAWVVPAPPTVTVEDSDAQSFVDFEATTSPTLSAPIDPCAFATSGDSSAFACGGSDSSPTAGFAVAEENGVIVFDRGETDTYTYEVVGADDSAVLVEWLRSRDYNIGDNMIPAMQAYLTAEFAFVALKLLADQSADAIKPIALTFPGTMPMVPLQLTAVAAQPRMGVEIAILASGPYRPVDQAMIDIDADDLSWRVDDSGAAESNYPAWVARQVDEADGALFVREYARSLDGWEVPEIFQDGQFHVTRLYTRLNPEQMTFDPMFEPDTGGGDTLLNHAAPVDHAPVLSCGSPTGDDAPPCAFTYCGQNARCVEVADRAHCECPDGQVSQAFAGPLGRELTCVPETNPLAVESPPDAVCPAGSCVEGTCTLKGGFPVCRCPTGYAARVEGTGLLCGIAPPATAAVSPGAGAKAGPRRDPNAPDPSQSRYAGGTLGYLLLLGAAAGVVARRRRRD